MNPCTEFAVFRVEQKNVARAIELSEAIFTEMNTAMSAEMNTGEAVISAYQILRKTDNPEEICWHLTWINAEAAKATTQKWPSFASTGEFQGLVTKDLYYGHFVNAL